MIMSAISSMVRSCTPMEPILCFTFSVTSVCTTSKLAAKARANCYLNLKDWNILK